MLIVAINAFGPLYKKAKIACIDNATGIAEHVELI